MIFIVYSVNSAIMMTKSKTRYDYHEYFPKWEQIHQEWVAMKSTFLSLPLG